MTGGGGWPMSVWLTPDLKPFVGATYFPPEDQVGGRPGFRTILNHISKQVWLSAIIEVLVAGSEINCFMQAPSGD